MSMSRILGVILVVIGLFLLILAWSSTHAIPDKLTAVATGRPTQSTIWYIITGLVMLIGGGALWIGGRPKP